MKLPQKGLTCTWDIPVPSWQELSVHLYIQFMQIMQGGSGDRKTFSERLNVFRYGMRIFAALLFS